MAGAGGSKDKATIRKLRLEIIKLEQEVGTLCARIMKLQEQLRNAGVKDAAD